MVETTCAAAEKEEEEEEDELVGFTTPTLLPLLPLPLSAALMVVGTDDACTAPGVEREFESDKREKGAAAERGEAARRGTEPSHNSYGMRRIAAVDGTPLALRMNSM